MGRLERAYLYGSYSVIAFVLILALARWRPAPSEPTPDPPPARPAQPPPPRSMLHYQARGNVVDLPGRPPSPALLRASEISLRSGDRVLQTLQLSGGGFSIDAEGPEKGVRLRLTTRLRFSPFDRSLDRELWREVPLDRAEVFLHELELPRSDELGEIRGQVVDTSGADLDPLSLLMDPVEGTSTPNIGLARGEAATPDAANAPSEIRGGGQFLITYVPPGTYELRARVPARLMLPARAKVVAGRRTEVTIAEGTSTRRFRGTLRDALNRRFLAGAELTVESVSYAGPATRDPMRLTGRTSNFGAFDLPLPDDLPAAGLIVNFTRDGYRRLELRLTANDFRDGVAKRDLELVRE